MVVGHALRLLFGVELVIKACFKLPATTRVEQDLVISEPASFFECDDFNFMSLVLPVIEPEQMRFTNVDEVQVGYIVISTDYRLTSPVQLARQICHNMLDKRRRCPHIPMVIVKEKLEPVYNVFKDGFKQPVLQGWIQLPPEFTVSERL